MGQGYGAGMRHAIAALGVALLVATGCSGDSASRGSAGAPTTQVIPTTTTSTSVAGLTSTVPSATTSVATTRPGTTPTSTPTPTTRSVAAGGPAAAEAGGWRLVVAQPAARATIGPSVAVCYEATGSSREPDLALEVTVLPSGPTMRVPVDVGRGTARFDLSAAGLGPRDLRVRLIVDGLTVDGLAVTIPVTISAGAGPGTCP